MMKTHSNDLIVAIGGLAVAFACSGELGDDAGMERGELEQQQSAGDEEAARIVFETRYSEAGTLQVSEDDAGELSVSVLGTIGTDDHQAAARALSEATLLDTYLALRPDADTLPEGLTALSERFAEQQAMHSADGAGQHVESARVQEKSYESFLSTACQKFTPTFEPVPAGSILFAGYSPNWCYYWKTTKTLCTPAEVGTNDMSAAWNESDFNVTQTLTGKPSYNIPPWHWRISTWSGKFSGKTACVTHSGSNRGHLGLTHHNYFTDVILNPVGG